MTSQHQQNNEPTANPVQTTEQLSNQPTTIELTPEQCAGHGDHWALLTDNIGEDVPHWLQEMVNTATVPHGLFSADELECGKKPLMLITGNQEVHINQVLAIKDGKPSHLISAFPAINSPYGVTAKIDRIIACADNQDAVLRLQTEDGTVLYAFDQLYTVNKDAYQKDTEYYINLSAWAYRIKPSDHDEVILIEDQEAIRYHRAFNDIVAANNGEVPEDIQQKIEAWQPDTDTPLAPVEINMGNMCAYLFGETLGQEDDSWIQGQVLGKQETKFNDVMLTLFDVVILREPDTDPVVVRIGTRTTPDTNAIQVQDYIQANLWIQGAAYKENQK